MTYTVISVITQTFNLSNSSVSISLVILKATDSRLELVYKDAIKPYTMVKKCCWTCTCFTSKCNLLYFSKIVIDVMYVKLCIRIWHTIISVKFVIRSMSNQFTSWQPSVNILIVLTLKKCFLSVCL